MISGAIPPPRFNLENLAAIERHVNSVVLEEAAIDYASSLELLLTDRGDLIENNVRDLVQRLAKAALAAKRRASEIFPGIPGVTTDWLESVVGAFPQKVRDALNQRER